MYDLNKRDDVFLQFRCKNRKKHPKATNGNPSLMIQILAMTFFYTLYDRLSKGFRSFFVHFSFRVLFLEAGRTLYNK